MKIGNNKTIFFDLYQTLIDVDIDAERQKINEAKAWKALARSLKPYGASVSSAELFALIGKHRADFYTGKDEEIHHHNLYMLMMSVLREDLGIHISEDEIASLLYAYRKIARGYVRLYPGVIEVLGELEKKYTLAVASYTQGCYTHIELKELGLEVFFSHFIYTSDVGFRKTSPAFYARCLEIVGKRAEECIMIGDNYDADVLVPQKLGMKAIWVRNPVSAARYAHLYDEGHDTMINIDDFGKLPHVMSQTSREKLS